MTSPLSILIAQIDTVVGDIAGNVQRIRDVRVEAVQQGVDLVVFPELCITGYPPEDLVYRSAFQEAAMEAIDILAKETTDGGPALLVGGIWRDDVHVYNAALVLADGKIVHRQFKYKLPNYGVFDEKRVFSSGYLPSVFTLGGTKLGIMICEDMWFPDVAAHLAKQGAELLLVPNASPFELGKAEVRLEHARARVAESGVSLVYVNTVGGQDELVFDGGSFVMGADGVLVEQLPFWEEAVLPAFTLLPSSVVTNKSDYLSDIYYAMMVGLRDYVNKNGFKGVVLGLSGGIDSALSTAVAVDALGAERVRTVMMPSRYTSEDSLEDAAACSKLLGVAYDTIPIESAVEAFDGVLAESFAGLGADSTEENLQSRIRGNILMALSNKFGLMVLTTGNKSEMATGYATLYGDMCGGYSVLKDVYKTAVFAVSEWRNATIPKGALGPEGMVMPERVITKAPTAELKTDQMDQDTLPPYEVLDPILECLIEREMNVDAIVSEGFDREVVEQVANMLYASEYKRRQAPPGVKISSMNFGRDRRYPLTNAWRD